MMTTAAVEIAKEGAVPGAGITNTSGTGEDEGHILRERYKEGAS